MKNDVLINMRLHGTISREAVDRKLRQDQLVEQVNKLDWWEQVLAFLARVSPIK